MKIFYNFIKKSESEKEVSDLYINNLKKYIKYDKVNYIYNCDGYLEGTIKYDSTNNIIKLLMEFKKNKNFYEKKDQCEVILQALFYVKEIIDKSCKTPEILLIGDKNTCFVISLEDIIEYLNMNIEWNIAPSKSSSVNKDIINEMIKDNNINPFIFRINESFNFKEVVNEIKNLAKGLRGVVKVSEENIEIAYDYFISSVIRYVRDYRPDELVQIFIAILINPEDNYKHPNNNDILMMSSGKRVNINGKNFDVYFNHFKLLYKPSEIRKFTEISDRLVEDTLRRRKGEYYTPTTWANIAHTYISKVFGIGWKDEFLVWDCAWGTGNLTRDYRFNNLYCSTLDDQDLIIGESYNKEAKEKFQYDFLNDDMYEHIGQLFLEEKIKMPKELLEAFENNHKIMFFINPPFAAAGSGGAKGTSKKGIAKSKVNELMKKNGLGKCSQQVFIQFIYKIMLLKQRYSLADLSLCFFSTPIFLTGESYKEFRKEFMKMFKFKGGFLFKASNFSDVKSNWGITFSMWRSENERNKDNFTFDIMDYVNGKVEKIGKKVFYNTDFNISCSSWIREETKNIKTYDAPQMKNAINIKDKGTGKLVKNEMGYYVNSANGVNENDTYVLITSSASCKGHGVSIIESNFMKVVSLFASRKLISGKYSNWINIRDEYFKPHINNPLYEKWNNDAIIYSIFSNSSQQSSLRNIEYKGKYYDIKNEFFFESKEIMVKYSDASYNNEIYNDAITDDKERYVFELLKNIRLSKEAENVMDYAREVLKNSFKYRKEFNKLEPQYQINNWDAGWYQVKALLKKYDPNSLEEFNNLFRILENRMRPMVCKLGFLK